MKSVLNVSVSKFKNYKGTVPATINLLDWLQDSTHKEKVDKIRLITDKQERDNIKATLPTVTISGLFGARNKNCLLKHSGLICIDIDRKDNLLKEDFYEMKRILSCVSYVAYCGLSVSGEGYYVIIPIKYPDKHEAYFKALQKIFADNGINIDPACKDVTRVRGYSWDVSPYINHNAEIFAEIIDSIPRPVIGHRHSSIDRNATQKKVEQYVDEIIDTGIDITPTYKDWISVGFALASEFGEAGREYYQDVSQYHENYDYDKTDEQYTYCLESTGRGITISTFFHKCREAGL